ncbi:type III toxin-antitoxin system ToxN/AbiQ family toxin [Brackiella oedipodis]|uniref:type III toxin-antitoxin system ToxN/AbiQ family toxin n=1 Tax=Brackiella oedipodis TaxID=124225 RepID=UPI00146FB809|nr:type III toxin-antitoxin system ToxN/AbiQ family toxin [Brackiella oedipodis]
MNIYTIDNKFIGYLAKKENKVAFNKASKERSRPYVGVIIEVGAFNYFAPMSSRDMRKNRSNNTFHLFSKEQNLGVIHVNNMIPVPDNRFVKLLNYNKISSQKYKKLIAIQVEILSESAFQKELTEKAINLYNVVSDPNNNTRDARFLKKLSNDFKSLEKHCQHLTLENFEKQIKNDIEFDL